jgi:hypothetical protein
MRRMMGNYRWNLWALISREDRAIVTTDAAEVRTNPELLQALSRPQSRKEIDRRHQEGGM